jgi:glycosyltransferase involved in cell wall biosynthesis
MANKYLVIMPTYNEIDNLRISVEELFKHNLDVDLLIVDDNSPDGTGALADQISAQLPNVTVLHRQTKNGLGPAYLAGFDYAFEKGYEYVIEMDADGSHRAIDLPKLISQSTAADLVIGSRWCEGGAVLNWPAHRKAISKIGNWYTGIMLDSNIRDMTAGFRIYKTSLLKKLDLKTVSSHGYSFQVEMAWRSLAANAVTVESPITFVEREQGVSKMTASIVVEALWLVTKWGILRLLRGN